MPIEIPPALKARIADIMANAREEVTETGGIVTLVIFDDRDDDPQSKPGLIPIPGDELPPPGFLRSIIKRLIAAARPEAIHLLLAGKMAVIDKQGDPDWDPDNVDLSSPQFQAMVREAKKDAKKAIVLITSTPLTTVITSQLVRREDDGTYVFDEPQSLTDTAEFSHTAIFDGIWSAGGTDTIQ